MCPWSAGSLQILSQFIRFKIQPKELALIRSRFPFLQGVYGVLEALEMNTGKVPFIEAMNGSDVLLPCIYISCIGIEHLQFRWEFNNNGTMDKVRSLLTEHL